MWLYNNNGGGNQLYLASSNGVFINAAANYNKFSSRELKENIIPLNSDESLDMVSRWQPVEFDLISDGTHMEGFISEDHVKVTPSMVNVCGPESKRPGWANAISYEQGTIRLTGAVQALLRRIEELERKVA